jgi:hypothetical protein
MELSGRAAMTKKASQTAFLAALECGVDIETARAIRRVVRSTLPTHLPVDWGRMDRLQRERNAAIEEYALAAGISITEAHRAVADAMDEEAL